ncbi:Uncharacterised protein [Actinobacillus equuli]|nr:Uncharacterised protein [Actinobacillus equuli]
MKILKIGDAGYLLLNQLGVKVVLVHGGGRKFHKGLNYWAKSRNLSMAYV